MKTLIASLVIYAAQAHATTLPSIEGQLTNHSALATNNIQFQARCECRDWWRGDSCGAVATKSTRLKADGSFKLPKFACEGSLSQLYLTYSFVLDSTKIGVGEFSAGELEQVQATFKEVTLYQIYGGDFTIKETIIPTVADWLENHNQTQVESCIHFEFTGINFRQFMNLPYCYDLHLEVSNFRTRIFHLNEIFLFAVGTYAANPNVKVSVNIEPLNRSLGVKFSDYSTTVPMSLDLLSGVGPIPAQVTTVPQQ